MGARPTVCHVIFEHAPQDGRVFHKEATTLAAAGFPSVLLAPQTRPGRLGSKSEMDWTPGTRINGVEFAAYSYSRLIPRGQIRNRLALNSLRKRLLEIRPDICVFHEDTFTMEAAADLKELLPGAKLVFDFHEFFLHRLREKLHTPRRVLRYLDRENRVMKSVDLILAVSDWYRDYYRTLSDAPVVTIHNAQSEGIFGPPAAVDLPDAFWVVHEGRLSFDRGLRLLMETAAKVRSPEVRFLVIGFLPDKERRYFDAQPESLRNRFHITGMVPYAKVPDYMARGRAGISFRFSPNAATGVPNKFYNYIRFGMPVLGTPSLMQDLLIERHELGMVGRDPAELAAFIDRLHDEPDTLRRISDNARRAFLTELNWEVSARSLVQAFESLTP